LSALLYLLLTLVAIPATAQLEDSTIVLRFSHSIPVASAATVSVDRNGSVYLLDKGRSLFMLDSLGKPLNAFSPPSRGRI
jgi:hypothetical protein